MNTLSSKLAPALLSALTVMVAAGCASTSRMGMHDESMQGMYGDHMQGTYGDNVQGMPGGMMMGRSSVRLDGSHEVPPVNSAAIGRSTITVSADKAVRGSIMTRSIDATAAHIHEGAAGVNGPVIIPLAKNANNAWAVPAGAMLTDAQYASYMSGNLYVNVHSAAHPGGEIRAQLVPK